MRHFLGIPPAAPHSSEQWAAILGSLLGIACVFLITHSLLGQHTAVFVVPSLGATAVLVFAAPHSLFAQPWAVLAGNLLSAIAGVLCQQMVPDPTLAAASAVALAIAVMHLTRSLHPPGGATALAAVIGGPDIHQLGYGYVLLPVGINCLILIAVGIAFNHAFAWRRYPASLMRYVHHETPPSAESVPSEENIQQAMARLKGMIDVSPAELKEVIEQSLLLARQSSPGNPEFPLRVGAYYGNRHSGRHWSVRQIISAEYAEQAENDVLNYRIVEGKGRHRFGHCTRAEFSRWAGRQLRQRKARP
ncbi:MAG: HPP family protein [Zoogloeaceae bacterium]|nr:HPP family protein [Zoogloeaceae bacterium]